MGKQQHEFLGIDFDLNTHRFHLFHFSSFSSKGKLAEASSWELVRSPWHHDCSPMTILGCLCCRSSKDRLLKWYLKEGDVDDETFYLMWRVDNHLTTAAVMTMTRFVGRGSQESDKS